MKSSPELLKASQRKPLAEAVAHRVRWSMYLILGLVAALGAWQTYQIESAVRHRLKNEELQELLHQHHLAVERMGRHLLAQGQPAVPSLGLVPQPRASLATELKDDDRRQLRLNMLLLDPDLQLFDFSPSLETLYFNWQRQRQKVWPLLAQKADEKPGANDRSKAPSAVMPKQSRSALNELHALNALVELDVLLADVSYVYTRTGPGKKDLTTFIVEKDAPGFSVSKEIHKMGMRTSPTAELAFQNCKVPETARVGQEGESAIHMMKNLEIERITIAGISLGVAQACVDQCIKYAGERKQFGKNLANFQMIQKMIAEMATETETMRRLLYTVCYEYDHGHKSNTLASMVKLQLPKMATKIALDAIQLHGGYGYSREFPVERLMRDNKLNEIGAGTNEVMIMIIAKNLLKDALKE